MLSALNRRNFLKLSAFGAAGLSLGRVGSAAETTPLATTRLTDNLMLISGAGGNVVVLDGADGLMLVNGSSPERTTDLMRFLNEQFKGKRVASVFNTDWHLEHSGSNEAFRKT